MSEKTGTFFVQGKSGKGDCQMPFEIIKGDITKIKADAIVNAANTGLKMGGGVCGAIFSAAGARELQAECDRIGGCEVGKAVITKGYALPARYIIHTPGPVWRGGTMNEAILLAASYRNSLVLAAEHGCASIAFPLISSGIYGYPKDQALKIAVDTIGKFLLQNDMQVYLVVFDKDAVVLDKELIKSISLFLDENYREEDSTDGESEGCRTDMSCHAEGEDHYDGGGRFYDGKPVSVKRPAYDDSNYYEEADIHRMMERQENNYLSEEHAEGRDEARVATEAGYDDMCGTGKGMGKSAEEEIFPLIFIRLMNEKKMTDSEICGKANISWGKMDEIRRNPDYPLEKATVIAAAIGLQLGLPDTETFLEKAGYRLSNGSRADLIVAYFIKKGNYNIHEINEVLFVFGQAQLN